MFILIYFNVEFIRVSDPLLIPRKKRLLGIFEILLQRFYFIEVPSKFIDFSSDL